MPSDKTRPTTPRTLIDFAQPHGDARRLRLGFGAPSRVLVARTAAEVRPVLDAVEALAREGRWCVGYLRYEAAAAFDRAFAVHAVHAEDGPLAWFGVHDEALPWPEAPGDDAAPSIDWQPGISRADFDRRMQAIHRAISNGELYQLNYTAALHARFDGDAQALFMALRQAQPDGYTAFIDTGEEQVLSVSPELFFDWQGDRILTRPMKGTAPRGATPAEDEALAQRLRTVPKERAENVMIVDLIRNDLSRVARPFSVRVPRLFHTEALPTVWQMTSDVEALVREGTTLADVFGALFPCGSITGAPKVSAMRMIRELEPEARGVYCGAVGIVRPGGHATFNVPIRTVTLRNGEARCGIGSGITADARADAEWEEWHHKRAFLDRAGQASTPSFDLLETLALADGELRDAPEHLARMAAAAAHFGRPWNEETVARCLDGLKARHAAGMWRVRLLLDAQGTPRAEAFAMEAPPARVRLQLAERPFDEAHGDFTRFKTTRRAHYEAFAPTAPGVFDTLLWNRDREITECTRGNIALLLDGRWVTPPLHCGLLNGIGRANRVRGGQLAEAVVRVDDLPRVRALAFVNSLRGWLDADLDGFQK
ncbi:aminodeoxychorismate synthase component I [Variovorax sp. NFACC27]|uniref:aminodeoxychorismate synthase component I n=1 Tax=unclassified Variovorax TaxID=663243 RepID=UPI000899B502|nr:para-aminobenzoate synthetase / 4-amino-4-deoxychorismate lyase [Variovorax sp. NFACC28]SEG30929.1 para-aminobenzoate synthetase / 4-amino-4-deoxychorismate lyase [Variovorax sp. NFACC29]SFC41096.1 para-aminobenzoate synthetase / 4-amino-4-deoxychorismate lyase [Variovorax sp. NFACC26]SFF90303.1 para-aminobenzoate synthetase / 4-amino-4-deoxychorismate lyase [Variovorax sp. NFACC27]